MNIKPYSIKALAQRGMATLAISAGLLAAATVISLFSAKSGLLEQKVFNNDYQSKQAFAAAEAGMEYGISHLLQNKPTIINDSNNSGTMDSYTDQYTTNVALGNGSKYTIEYSNPINNNFDVILIKATGVNNNSTTVKKISQLVKFIPLFYGMPNSEPLIVKKEVKLGGDANIINTENNKTIWTGETPNIDGNAETILASGTSSDRDTLGSDINVDNNLGNMTDADMFEMFFKTSKPQTQNKMYLENSTNYNTALNGKENMAIWIDNPNGTVTINANTTVGSPERPVILIINGNLKLNGNAKIYGFVYVSKELVSPNGHAKVYGSMAVEGDIDVQGEFQLTYDSTVLALVNKNLGSYAKVAGSWNDLQS